MEKPSWARRGGSIPSQGRLLLHDVPGGNLNADILCLSVCMFLCSGQLPGRKSVEVGTGVESMGTWE